MRVVVAALIERGGRILVSQRPDGSGYARYWEFPGGKREPGESDAAALARELCEELGISVAIGDRVWRKSAPPLDLRFHRCTWLPRQRPRPVSVRQFRWVRAEDLGGLAFPPADAELIEQLAAGDLF